LKIFQYVRYFIKICNCPIKILNYIIETNKFESLTKEEINALAKEVLKLEQMTILIVGDKEKIKAPLEKSGYKIVDYKEVETATYEKN
jgi:N-dimethylarginine dimethylaminohydrolase